MKTLQVLKQAPIKNHQADCQHVRVIKSLADLDQMLDELDAAAAISDDGHASPGRSVLVSLSGSAV